MSTTTLHHTESIAPATETVFTMRVVLPLDADRTGINRMVHACADIITHMGDNGLSATRKQYITDPFDGRIVTGEWAIGPDPDPQGTATYAFNEHEIAVIRTALRQLPRAHTLELSNPEIDALCDRLNPFDAVTR